LKFKLIKLRKEKKRRKNEEIISNYVNNVSLCWFIRE